MQTFLIPTEEPKDLEDENISISVAKPSTSRLPIEKAREQLKGLMTDLGWDNGKKTEWAKSINPQPYVNWTIEDWNKGIHRASHELTNQRSHQQ